VVKPLGCKCDAHSDHSYFSFDENERAVPCVAVLCLVTLGSCSCGLQLGDVLSCAPSSSATPAAVVGQALSLLRVLEYYGSRQLNYPWQLQGSFGFTRYLCGSPFIEVNTNVEQIYKNVQLNCFEVEPPVYFR